MSDIPARGRGDRGAASSLATVLLAPIFVVIAFAAFQAALWSHARTEVRVVARDAAGALARSGAHADDVRNDVGRALGPTNVRDVRVTAGTDGGLAVVTIEGRAPGIIRGTWAPVRARVAIPVEGWRS